MVKHSVSVTDSMTRSMQRNKYPLVLLQKLTPSSSKFQYALIKPWHLAIIGIVSTCLIMKTAFSGKSIKYYGALKICVPQ